MMLGTSISIASDLSSKIILTFEFRLLLRTTSRRRIKFHVSVLKMMLIGNFILILTSLRVKVHQNGFGITRCALANVRDVYCFLKTLTLLSREVVDHTWGINVCNFESCVDILSSSTFKKPSKWRIKEMTVRTVWPCKIRELSPPMHPCTDRINEWMMLLLLILPTSNGSTKRPYKVMYTNANYTLLLLPTLKIIFFIFMNGCNTHL